MLAKRILVAADFSEPSLHAFQLALALARDSQAHLDIVHVAVAPPMVTPSELQRTLQGSGGYRADLEARLRSAYPTDGACAASYVILDGDPVVELLQAVHDRACQLVVMGTHARSGFGRVLLGSVATAVIRKADCPVLTVRGPAVSKSLADDSLSPASTRPDRSHSLSK
jgi:nucleotide-binding universal stress UspA family protein